MPVKVKNFSGFVLVRNVNTQKRVNGGISSFSQKLLNDKRLDPGVQEVLKRIRERRKDKSDKKNGGQPTDDSNHGWVSSCISPYRRLERLPALGSTPKPSIIQKSGKRKNNEQNELELIRSVFGAGIIPEEYLTDVGNGRKIAGLDLLAKLLHLDKTSKYKSLYIPVYEKADGSINAIKPVDGMQESKYPDAQWRFISRDFLYDALLRALKIPLPKEGTKKHLDTINDVFLEKPQGVDAVSLYRDYLNSLAMSVSEIALGDMKLSPGDTLDTEKAWRLLHLGYERGFESGRNNDPSWTTEFDKTIDNRHLNVFNKQNRHRTLQTLLVTVAQHGSYKNQDYPQAAKRTA